MSLYSTHSFYGLTGVKAFSGLRSLLIFHEVLPDYLKEETYVNLKKEGLALRQGFLAFKDLHLTSVQVCLFRALRTGGPEPKEISRTDPDLFNSLLEEMEAKLLANRQERPPDLLRGGRIRNGVYDDGRCRVSTWTFSCS